MDIKPSLDLAMRYFSSGELDKAKKIFTQILQGSPNNPIALHFYGLFTHNEGRTDDAINLIKKALTEKPDYAEALYNLGIIFKKTNKFNEAINAFSNAIRLKPDYANAYFNLSIVFAIQGKYQEAIGGYYRCLAHKPDHADAYFKLARIFTIVGDLDKAILNYRKFLKLEPNTVEAYNNIGNALRLQGKTIEAISYYKKALSINPNIQNSRHFLNALTGVNSDRAPREYVKRIFNKYANNFDDHLVEKLSYETPTILRKLIMKMGLSDRRFKNAIDLGCGTGLSGIQFRGLSDYLIGVDISENMISKAKEKNIYDELYVDEIVDNLNETKCIFDLFICTDVLVYFGDLSNVFQCIRNRCNGKALFLFSTENTNKDSFILNEEGRYAHSPNHINTVSINTGFHILHSEQIDLRKENGHWIQGDLYILQSI